MNFPIASLHHSSLAANQANLDILWKYVCQMMKQVDDLTRETQDLRITVFQLQQNIDFLNKEQAYAHINSNNSAQALRMQAPALGTGFGDYRALKEQIQSKHRIALPDDVLRNVFANCLPNEGKAEMKSREAPLVFGWVCSNWRRVAWSAHELWNTFELEIPTLIGYPFHQLHARCNAYVSGIADWIKRSGNLPLYIALIDRNPLDWELAGRKKLLQRVVEEITPYSARWKSIRFELPAFIVKSHLHVNSLDLSALEMFGFRNLSLEWASFQPLGMTRHNDLIGCHPIMENNSRRLRSLHLTDPTMVYAGYALQAQPSFTSLKWDSLLDLTICTESSPFPFIGLDISTAHGILKHLAASATQLRSCRMTLISRDATLRHQICLPSLHELAITLLVGEPSLQEPRRTPIDHRISQLFSCLKCPSLCSFMYRADMESVLPFLSFLKETPGLKKLHVDSVRAHSGSNTLQDWKECLQICPHITELHSSTALSTFSPADISSILPSLEILVLDCTPPLDRTGIFQPTTHKHSTSESLLRRDMERDRRLKLRQRIGLIMALCRPKKDPHGELQLKEVRFRLSERLRDEALHHLAPVIAMGLRVTFKDDYSDIPPPFGSPPLRGITKFYMGD